MKPTPTKISTKFATKVRGVGQSGTCWQAMRVLLRDNATGLYCDDSGGWVTGSWEAHDFEGIESAAQRRRDAKLGNAEIVLDYADPGLRSSFDRKGTAERSERAAYRGPIPMLPDEVGMQSAVEELRCGDLTGGPRDEEQKREALLASAV